MEKFITIKIITQFGSYFRLFRLKDLIRINYWQDQHEIEFLFENSEISGNIDDRDQYDNLMFFINHPKKKVYSITIWNEQEFYKKIEDEEDEDYES